MLKGKRSALSRRVKPTEPESKQEQRAAGHVEQSQRRCDLDVPTVRYDLRLIREADGTLQWKD
jgi:hypothetical protein